MADTRAEPDDFDDFWSSLVRRAREVVVQPTSAGSPEPGTRLVEFTSLDGLRLGGWLTLPPGEIRSAVIIAHGYGGRAALDSRWAPADAAVFYPIARGMPTLSLIDGIPSVGREHVLHGIQSRDTYVHGGCAADVWCAISALEELLGAKLGERHGGVRLGYFGPSFGGGIGALAIPWDDRIDAASLYVPAFGAHVRRLAIPNGGSSSALRDWVQEHPEAWDVLDYFDAATAASRIDVPTIIAAAREDPSVPPVGQFAVADAVPQRHRRVMAMTAGHRSYPEEEAEMAEYAAATRALFSAR
ncbi:acetylxylan esterase [Microbacterium sp. A84]|uniref:acetylxylan esterase n=1 Tax=Microbacterium sp. A84 TaxID=3450715 RepID=UPI003F432E57